VHFKTRKLSLSLVPIRNVPPGIQTIAGAPSCELDPRTAPPKLEAVAFGLAIVPLEISTELATRLTQAALIGVLFIGFLFYGKTNKT
jgi:hypothetical protein